AVLLVPIFLAWPMLSPVPWLPLDLLDRINELVAKHGLTLADALNLVHSKTPAAPTDGPLKRIIGNALMEQRFDTTYLWWVAISFLVGALVPIVIMPFALRKVQLPKPVGHPRSEALPYTLAITVLTAVATYYFLDHPKQSAGSFLIATILVLTQVDGDIKWRLTVERVLGTLVGVVLFIVITNAINATHYTEVVGLPFPLRMYVAGLIFGTLAIIAKFSPRLWIYYVLIVPAAAALNAFSFHQAADLGEQRLVDNLVGAALVIAAALITLGASRVAQKAGIGPSSGSPVDAPTA
ncbi:MAG: FUSC family protein, partial [Gaiellales bacterium]